MVKIALQLSCVLENINILSTCGSDFGWNLKVECCRCRNVDANWHQVIEEVSVEGQKGPGSFNFQMKCKFCSNIMTLVILKDSVKPLRCDDSFIINKQTAVVMDCRGCEPVDFDPQGGWVGKSDETGTEFPEIDFSEGGGTWVDYDNKGKCPVSIDDLKWTFVRIK